MMVIMKKLGKPGFFFAKYTLSENGIFLRSKLEFISSGKCKKKNE